METNLIFLVKNQREVPFSNTGKLIILEWSDLYLYHIGNVINLAKVTARNSNIYVVCWAWTDNYGVRGLAKLTLLIDTVPLKIAWLTKVSGFTKLNLIRYLPMTTLYITYCDCISFPTHTVYVLLLLQQIFPYVYKPRLGSVYLDDRLFLSDDYLPNLLLPSPLPLIDPLMPPSLPFYP